MKKIHVRLKNQCKINFKYTKHSYFLTYISYIPRAYLYECCVNFIISDPILNAGDISCHHL